MSVTVDQQPLAAEEMGMQTVGQVLAHLQRDNRLVVHVLIDGQEPDLGQLGAVKRMPLREHTLFIETADPRQLAASALDAVEAQLAEADRLRGEACDLIAQGVHHRAMEKLSGCLTTWQHAQESVLKTSQLLRLDLEKVAVEGRPLTGLIQEFAEQLRQIKGALEDRDFVRLNDILTYEATQTSAQWKSAVGAMKRAATA